MGIIPWLLMLRLRARQAQRDGAGGSKEQEKIQRMNLDMSDYLRKQTEQVSRDRYDPNRTVDELFGRL